MTQKKRLNLNHNQGEYWTSLAVLAQQGDKHAYAELLRDIMPSIQRFLAGKLKDPDWIDDITQEVLMSVHKSLHTYSPDRPFRPWLMAIINFRKTDHLRKYYRRKDQSEAIENDDENTPEFFVTEAGTTGELKDIERALDSLSDKQKEIFTLVRVEGYSMREVAEEMDMSESAVKVSVHRSAKKLQEILGSQEQDRQAV